MASDRSKWGFSMNGKKHRTPAAAVDPVAKARFYKQREDWRMAVMASPARFSDKACAVVISSHINHESEEGFPSQATIATEMNTSEVTVQECIRRLCALGFLSKRRGGFGKSNRYEMVYPPSIPQAGHENEGAIFFQAQHGNDATSSQATQGNWDASISQAQPVSVPKHSNYQSHAEIGPNLKDNLKGEPLKGAALQAPAPLHTPPLPPKPVLRAPEGLRAGATETIDPRVLEIIEDAVCEADANPDLMRPDYVPPQMDDEEAARCCNDRPASLSYKFRASKLREARLCDERSIAAHRVLMNSARLVDHASAIVDGSGKWRDDPIPDDDEVPF